jgi:hypothetical protein
MCQSSFYKNEYQVAPYILMAENDKNMYYKVIFKLIWRSMFNEIIKSIWLIRFFDTQKMGKIVKLFP